MCLLLEPYFPYTEIAIYHLRLIKRFSFNSAHRAFCCASQSRRVGWKIKTGLLQRNAERILVSECVAASFS